MRLRQARCQALRKRRVVQAPELAKLVRVNGDLDVAGSAADDDGPPAGDVRSHQGPWLFRLQASDPGLLAVFVDVRDRPDGHYYLPVTALDRDGSRTSIGPHMTIVARAWCDRVKR